MHRGAGGIAEEIQKTPARGHRPDARAHQSVIEEQPGIEEVAEIDVEFQASFFHQVVLMFACHPYVLTGAALPPAHPQINIAGFDLHGAGQRCQGFGASALRRRRLNAVGSGILLHSQMHALACRLLIAIDREGVLGHVGIVKPVTTHLLRTRAAPEQALILEDAIGEHLRARARHQRRIRRCPLTCGASRRARTREIVTQ